MCIAAAIGGAAVVGAVASNSAAGKQADAAGNASDAQQQSARDSIAFQRESRDLARSDLSPFVNFAIGAPGGTSMQPGQPAAALPQTESNFDANAYLLANPDVAQNPNWAPLAYQHYLQHGKSEGRQFTPVAGNANGLAAGSYAPDSPLGQLSTLLTQKGQTDYLSNNPLFQIGMDKLNRQSSNSFLGRGKVGSANNQIVKNAFLAGQPLLQQQTSNLFGAAQLGQSSAAGQASGALTSGQGIANTIEGAGNSQAAGYIGAGNAQAQGLYGVANAAGTAAGTYAAYKQPLYGGRIPSIYGNNGGAYRNYNEMVA